jgi:hypothetical protein
MVANHKRVLRVMRTDNLLAVRFRKFVLTTDSQHDCQVYVTLAARLTLTGANQLWVADIAYICVMGRTLTTSSPSGAEEYRLKRPGMATWASEREVLTRLRERRSPQHWLFPASPCRHAVIIINRKTGHLVEHGGFRSRLETPCDFSVDAADGFGSNHPR